MDIDFTELAALVALLKEADFSEFRYEKGEVRISVRRGEPQEPAPGPVVPPVPARPGAAAPASPAAIAAPRPAAAPGQAVAGALVVKAPMLGTFYASPKPGEPAFVQVGDRVEPGTVLCIVEVMKLMNSVCAGVHGVVVAAHASDGELVEFGQVLFSLREDAP